LVFRSLCSLSSQATTNSQSKDQRLKQRPKTQAPNSQITPFLVPVHPVLDSPQLMIRKIMSPEQMLRERESLRSVGLRLVFTNGVFDLLHIGHVRYLAAARELGDALVVAINSDRTVHLLKGDSRPVFNQNERAEILAALRMVDYVTIFDEVSPRSLIATILPDVLVKGGDYEIDEIHGREEVEAAGGRVVSLPFVDGASTTSIIERMKE